MKTRSITIPLVFAFIGFFMLVKVVPVIAEHWLASHDKLPAPLHFLVNLGRFIGRFGILFIIAGLVGVYAFWRKTRKPRT